MAKQVPAGKKVPERPFCFDMKHLCPRGQRCNSASKAAAVKLGKLGKHRGQYTIAVQCLFPLSLLACFLSHQ